MPAARSSNAIFAEHRASPPHAEGFCEPASGQTHFLICVRPRIAIEGRCLTRGYKRKAIISSTRAGRSRFRAPAGSGGSLPSRPTFASPARSWRLAAALDVDGEATGRDVSVGSTKPLFSRFSAFGPKLVIVAELSKRLVVSRRLEQRQEPLQAGVDRP
jgi:hypothetical protein